MMSYPTDYDLDDGQRRFWTGPRATIVCLCGSTRFWRVFQEAALRETLAGKIVLSIGAARQSDDDDTTRGGHLPASAYDQQKDALDALHLQKIELADEVLILNAGRDYVGHSTAQEMAYARKLRKTIRWLEPASRALPGEERVRFLTEEALGT